MEAEDYDHALDLKHFHWHDLEELYLRLKHHLYHYMHVAGHTSYLAFAYLEGHGIESYICGFLFLLTAYGVFKGLDV